MVGKELVKNTKYNAPNSIKSKQCNNAIKQILEKKIEDADKKIPEFSGLVTVNLLKTKISEFENKLPDTTALELLLFLM